MNFVRIKSVAEVLRRREIKGASKTAIDQVCENLPFDSSPIALRAVTPTNNAVLLLQINCNNTLIAAAHVENVVTLYDVSSGKCVGRCEGHQNSPWSLKVSVFKTSFFKLIESFEFF